MSKKVAVILAGCGFLDGAEIRESVLTLTALDAEGADVTIFAPNKPQHHIINHLKSEESAGERNILEESARIARCQVTDLKELNPGEFDALIMPGGFGVAKNLCTWAFKGSACEVDSRVEQVLKGFYESKKPIGAICIAPALVAKVLGSESVSVTIGNDKETAAEIEKTGATHVDKEVHEAHVDQEHKIVSTPAYMYDQAKLHRIQQGISLCVSEVLKLA